MLKISILLQVLCYIRQNMRYVCWRLYHCYLQCRVLSMKMAQATNVRFSFVNPYPKLKVGTQATCGLALLSILSPYELLLDSSYIPPSCLYIHIFSYYVWWQVVEWGFKQSVVCLSTKSICTQTFIDSYILSMLHYIWVVEWRFLLGAGWKSHYVRLHHIATSKWRCGINGRRTRPQVAKTWGCQLSLHIISNIVRCALCAISFI